MPAAAVAPATRTPGARRANRAVLAVLGLLLLAAGATGLAAGLGAFGADVRTRQVIPSAIRDWASRHDWFWILVAAGCILVALLALRWLLAQASTSRIGELELESDRRRGRTVMTGRAVTDAVAGEIGSYRGVGGVRASLLGDRAAPTLLVRATLDGRADPAAVSTRIQTDAVPHTRQALEMPDLPVRLELRLAARSRRDLR
jgi:hypothetical protein